VGWSGPEGRSENASSEKGVTIKQHQICVRGKRKYRKRKYEFAKSENASSLRKTQVRKNDHFVTRLLLDMDLDNSRQEPEAISATEIRW